MHLRYKKVIREFTFMIVSPFNSRYFVLYSVFICCMLAVLGTANLHSQETETPDREQPLQVDIITFMFSAKPSETVDMRYVARNLYNKTIYHKGFETMALTFHVFLPSGTVGLLKTALTSDSEEVRERSAVLLGLSRNPEALPVITDSLQNDPSWRVQKAAAIALGMLAGEAAVPPLNAVLAARPTQDSSREHINYYGNYGFHVTDGALFGLGYAGGEGVPILIQMLEDEIADSRDMAEVVFFLECLEYTSDRRAIRPLIDIISKPASPSDPNWDCVRKRSATVLADFVDEERYAFRIQVRNDILAKGFPVTPAKNRQVAPRDRNLIREALQIAGYDTD